MEEDGPLLPEHLLFVVSRRKTFMTVDCWNKYNMRDAICGRLADHCALFGLPSDIIDVFRVGLKDRIV